MCEMTRCCCWLCCCWVCASSLLGGNWIGPVLRQRESRVSQLSTFDQLFVRLLLESLRQLEEFPLDAQVLQSRRDEKLTRFGLVWMRIEVSRLQKRRRNGILQRLNRADREHMKHQRPHCDLKRVFFSPINWLAFGLFACTAD
jgi:hypothetical protein